MDADPSHLFNKNLKSQKLGVSKLHLYYLCLIAPK